MKSADGFVDAEARNWMSERGLSLVRVSRIVASAQIVIDREMTSSEGCHWIWGQTRFRVIGGRFYF